MDTLRFPTFDGLNAVVAIEQIASVSQSSGWNGKTHTDGLLTWWIELKTGNAFRVEDVYGKRFADWFTGDITLQELHETFVA